MSSRIDLSIQPASPWRWLAALMGACNTVTRLTVEQGQAYAVIDNGERQPVSIAGESRIGRRVTLLKIRTVDARSQSHTVILADCGPRCRNVVPDEFRRLRMWLRLGQTRPSPASIT